MTEEQYKKADNIKTQLSQIDEELKLWEREIRNNSDLGYKQHWNACHLTELPCRHTSVEAFQAYRQACINSLKAKRAELTEEFNAI